MTLREDIENRKFGTKNRLELLSRLGAIQRAVTDIQWMARRYANGRHTYAPEMFNDAYDVLRTELGDAIDEKHSHAEGKVYHDIHMEESDVHPYAVDPDATQQDIKHKKFYGA